MLLVHWTFIFSHFAALLREHLSPNRTAAFTSACFALLTGSAASLSFTGMLLIDKVTTAQRAIKAMDL